MRIALEAHCCVATVRNWYGRRFVSRGQNSRLERAAKRLGLWAPVPPYAGGLHNEPEEMTRAAIDAGQGTPGRVAGDFRLPERASA